MLVGDELSFVIRHFYFGCWLTDIYGNRNHTVVTVHVL